MRIISEFKRFKAIIVVYPSIYVRKGNGVNGFGLCFSWLIWGYTFGVVWKKQREE